MNLHILFNWICNKHNCRTCSTQNYHVYVVVRTWNPEKNNVLTGNFGDQVIGPLLIINQNINGKMYLQSGPFESEPPS